MAPLLHLGTSLLIFMQPVKAQANNGSRNEVVFALELPMLGFSILS